MIKFFSKKSLCTLITILFLLGGTGCSLGCQLQPWSSTVHSHTQGLNQRWAKWRAAATAPHLLLKAARVHRLCARANSIAVVVVVVVVVGVGGQDGRGLEAPGDDDAILSPPVLVIFPKTSTSLIFFTP
jgi:hypothetical protein